jgi:hypothetical protein
MTSIPQVATAMNTVLNESAERAARSTGLVRRVRAMSGAQFVQTLVFAWLDHPDATSDDLAATAETLGVTITPQGFNAWFSDQSTACLQQVLQVAMVHIIDADPVAIPLVARFPAVWLHDSTVISLPAELAEQFRGCGGSHGAGTAALKAHLRLDIGTGQVDGPLLQDGRASDRAVAFRERAVEGSLTISDLGFFSLDDMLRAQRGGRHWVSRLKPKTAIFAPDGTRLDLRAVLDAAGTAQVDLAVHMGVAHRIPCRVVAERVPQEVADQRRRRLRADATNRGRTVSAERLAWCDWTVLVTTVPAEQLTIDEALVLLTVRWQIELLFKLWKDHGRVDESRGIRPARILTEIYAKMVAMIMQHWMLLTSCWQAPDRRLPKAAKIVRREAVHMPEALRAGDAAWVACLTRLQQKLARAGRQTPRQKEPNTYQLLLNPSLRSVS